MDIDVLILAVESSNCIDVHVGLLTLHHRGYLRSLKGILGIAVYDLYQLSNNLSILLDLNCGNGG